MTLPWGSGSETCPGPSEQTPLEISAVSPHTSLLHTLPMSHQYTIIQYIHQSSGVHMYICIHTYM